MSIIDQDLHQFSTYIQPINLSFHQYLLSTDEPLLLHTGNVQQATALVPQLKAILNSKTLKYIFVSHFEANECGGLSHILITNIRSEQAPDPERRAQLQQSLMKSEPRFVATGHGPCLKII